LTHLGSAPLPTVGKGVGMPKSDWIFIKKGTNFVQEAPPL